MKKVTQIVGSSLLAGGMLLGVAAPAQAWGIDRNNCYTTQHRIQSYSPVPGSYVAPGSSYYIQNYKKCLSVPTWFNQKFRGQTARYVTVESWKYDPQTNRMYDWRWGS